MEYVKQIRSTYYNGSSLALHSNICRKFYGKQYAFLITKKFRRNLFVFFKIRFIVYYSKIYDSPLAQRCSFQINREIYFFINLSSHDIYRYAFTVVLLQIRCQFCFGKNRHPVV